jgi:hypothetical protein
MGEDTGISDLITFAKNSSLSLVILIHEQALFGFGKRPEKKYRGNTAKKTKWLRANRRKMSHDNTAV